MTVCIPYFWGANFHADTAAEVPGHDRAAALEVELVLLDPAPPNLVTHQGAAGAAVDANLANLAESVDTVVYGLVIGDIGIGGKSHQPAAGANVGSKKVATGTLLAYTGGNVHRLVNRYGVARPEDLRVISLGSNPVAQLESRSAFRPIGAGVDDLSVNAGDGLSRLEVLFVG